MAIVRHQARRDNLADVAAKDGSQETLVNMLSLLVSLVLLPQVEARPATIWALFTFFTTVHLFANYRAVKCIQLETLNQKRLTLAVRFFAVHGTVPTIAECNRNEPVLGTLAIRRQLGCSLDALPAQIGAFVAKAISGRQTGHVTVDGFACKFSPSTVCVVAANGGRHANGGGWLAIADGAAESEIFNAVFELEFYAEERAWPNELVLSNFRHEMIARGWSLQVNQLDVDEWRYRRRQKWM
uniref:Protein root UVB sensitive/RUS domain-containing protein n=1 Tax=Globodera rostochiensis TaxID=31243 RepID=A0A914HC75_GLORO